ncbi:hypothetical protein AB9K41_00775, partial [Cribrihabitans sp. XS_ASV171]
LGLTVINPFPLYHYRSDDVAFVPFDSPIAYRSYFVTSATRSTPRIARAFMRHMRLNTPPDPFSRKGWGGGTILYKTINMRFGRGTKRSIRRTNP